MTSGWGLERSCSGPHPLYGVLWRCPTLPHPPRCSTIGACGLSFQVRNGDWAFPRGYDHHKISQPVFTCVPQRVGVCVGCDPHSGDEHFIVSVNHTVYTFVVEVFVSVGPLVPVGSRAPRGASTSGLSTRSSGGGLSPHGGRGNLILKQASRLDAFSGYPFRT